MTRSATDSVAVSCEATSTARSRPISVRSSRTSPPVAVSSSPVGSSATITSGSVESARAIATRCRSPPLSSPGRCVVRSPRPNRLEQVSRALPPIGSGNARLHERQRDVRAGGQRRQEVEPLEHDPDVVSPHPGSLPVGQRREVGVAQFHAALRRHQQPRDRVQDRRLSAAAGALESDDGPRRDVEGDVAERGHRALVTRSEPAPLEP